MSFDRACALPLGKGKQCCPLSFKRRSLYKPKTHATFGKPEGNSSSNTDPVRDLHSRLFRHFAFSPEVNNSIRVPVPPFMFWFGRNTKPKWDLVLGPRGVRSFHLPGVGSSHLRYLDPTSKSLQFRQGADLAQGIYARHLPDLGSGAEH